LPRRAQQTVRDDVDGQAEQVRLERVGHIGAVRIDPGAAGLAVQAVRREPGQQLVDLGVFGEKRMSAVVERRTADGERPAQAIRLGLPFEHHAVLASRE
jgi:hypothetical protein